MKLLFLASQLIVLLYQLLMAQSYNWPLEPFDSQHWINGTFCECRSGSSGDIDHFHDGVDIHLTQGGAVYSVVDGFVTSIGYASQYGVNSWVRVGRYAYVHVNPNPAINVNDPVNAFETILGWTNAGNHIHFKDGYPGSEINPLRLSGGLNPLIDEYDPSVFSCNFYIDGSQTQFSNNRIYGLVDIVCRASDITDNGPYGGNNGIFKIGFEIVNAEGNLVYGPQFPFLFDQIPSDEYISNVYFYGSNTSTYFYTITNNLTSNSFIDVSEWEHGFYTARIMTWDQYFNGDTIEQVFEVVEQDEIPPMAPTLLSILPDGNGFKITWLPNTEEDLGGYRLYFSYDMINWYNNHDESVLTADMTEYVAPSFGSNTGYFRLSAVDNSAFPNESEPSETYIFRKGDQNNRVLLIDTYSAAGQISDPPFISNMATHLEVSGQSFNTINDKYFARDSTFGIEEYPIVIVHNGIRLNEISETLAQLLLDRAESEQGTWLLGSSVLQSIEKSQSGQLLLNRIGISFDSNISLPEQINGVENTIFSDVSITVFEAILGMDSLNSIQIVTAQANLLNQVGKVLSASNENVQCTTFPMEILRPEDRSAIIINIINQLSYLTISKEPAFIPESISLTFFPNPFNSRGRIRLTGPNGDFELNLFNVLGEKIWYTRISKNSAIALISLPNQLIDSLSSGIYILQIMHLNSNYTISTTNKIVYMK